jgi:ATP-dependent Clp protease ATP-binding subunit ClpC
MLCDNCRSRPAVVLFQQRVDGSTAEMRLCHHCAGALGAPTGSAEAGPFGTLESLVEGLMGPRHRGPHHVLSQLSELAQQALMRAARLTLEWGHERIHTEFLLLALLEASPELREALGEAGLEVEDFTSRLEQVVPRREPRRAAGVGLSSGIKRVLQLARLQSLQLGHSFIGPEHLLLAILQEGESFAAQFLSAAPPEELRRRLAGLTGGGAGAGGGAGGGLGGPGGDGLPPAGGLGGAASPGGGPGRGAPPGAGRSGGGLPPHLARFSRDLTALARAGDLDPVIGRDAEIHRAIRILSRKTKNNPCLIGEPGVGKTAIAEGLAQRIVAGEVPDILRDKRVLALDLGTLLSGTRYRGDFEERFTGLMKEVRDLKGRIILFIDEIHTVVGAGAGGAEGAVDAANLLKPALARGELQCLGATTLDEYRRHIERDAALERRFQPVMVAEPTEEQAIEILRGLRDSYEAHHRVKISDEALTAAVELSDRYVPDRFLPDKAIDLVDEAAAMVRLGAHTEPNQMKALEERVAKLEKEKMAAVAAERFADAARLKGELETLRAEMDGLKRQWREKKGTTEPTVTPETVALVVSEWTGIPASRLQAEEAQRLTEMESTLRKRVVGQEDAIRAVSEAVRRARAGLKDPGRPIGSFLFLGPTGVGKTETARALAEFLFNDEQAMVRLDMSEFMERHTVSRLVGAPPGYVGYEDAGKLTEAVRRRPYSVVLFDEVEKAHPDVFNVLLQVLDDGRLTDAKGRAVSFKNTVLIMTSNVGARDLTELRGPVGFQMDEGDGGGRGEGGGGAAAEDTAAQARTREAVMAALREQFRPELLNRIDEVIVFQPLSRAQLASIVDLLLEGTRRKLRGQAVTLEVTEAAKGELVERGFEPKFGARPLRRAIQRELETRLSRLMLRGEVREGDTVRVDLREGDFVFEPRRHGASAPVGAGAPA